MRRVSLLTALAGCVGMSCLPVLAQWRCSRGNLPQGASDSCVRPRLASGLDFAMLSLHGGKRRTDGVGDVAAVSLEWHCNCAIDIYIYTCIYISICIHMCVNLFGPHRLPIYVYICQLRYSKWMFGCCHFSIVYIGVRFQMQVLSV